MNSTIPPTRTNTFHQSIAMLCGALLLHGVISSPIYAQPPEKPADADINAAVDRHLAFDSAVPSNEIDVTTTEGVVTLSGSAPNLLAKERALAITESVRGVRAIVNKIAVKAVTRTDDEIRKDVESALLIDPATDSYEVKPSVSSGVVTLTGTVDSWQEKQLASLVAKGVKGVKDVRNDIAVAYKSERPDTEIAAEVKASLKRDVWVSEHLIDASVMQGKVTLTGTVGSVAGKTRASANAWVAGVKSVDDSGLKVEPWARDPMKKDKSIVKSDEEIKKAVQDALLFDPRVFSFNPTVSVTNGVVTLTGVVDNLKAKRAAEQDAKNTAGVWRVKNYLKVRGKTQPPDDKIVQNVRDALLRDPYVDRYQIAVTAFNGVVYLTGTVDSYYEKSRAEDLASRVNGVTTINNNLVVSYPTYTYYNWPYTNYYYEPYYDNRPPPHSTWPYTSDLEVKDDIEDELFWSPFVDSDEVKVSVSNGIATLTGAVDSWSEYTSASENAWEGGARDVINNLSVR